MATSKIKSNNLMTANVTSNGVKTKAQIADELYALIDKSKLTGQSALEEKMGDSLSSYRFIGNSNSLVMFVRSHTASSYFSVTEWMLYASSSKIYNAEVAASSYSRTDEGSTVMPAGYTYRIRY